MSFTMPITAQKQFILCIIADQVTAAPSPEEARLAWSCQFSEAPQTSGLAGSWMGGQQGRGGEASANHLSASLEMQLP